MPPRLSTEYDCGRDNQGCLGSPRGGRQGQPQSPVSETEVLQLLTRLQETRLHGDGVLPEAGHHMYRTLVQRLLL